MKRAVRALISLYPKKWRNRYEGEFSALLSDVSPTWRTFFDVLGGAIKMHLKSWGAWKTVAAFGVIGLLAAAGFAWRMPDRYVSTVVIRVNGHWDGSMQLKLHAETERALSRRNLTLLILEEGLYKEDRAREPIEDIIARMKSRDVMIRPVMPVKDPHGVPVGFSVSFAAADAGQAQRTTERLAKAFVDSNIGFLLDAPSLPAHPERTVQTRIVLVGLAAGMLTGAVFALFMKLRVWKLAVGLGVGGAVLGAAVTFLLPERYVSTAVIFYYGADVSATKAEADMDGLIAAIESNTSLDAIAAECKLYPGDAHARDKVRQHLHIRHTRSIQYGAGVIISFESGDRNVAQKVVQSVTSRLMDEALRSAFDAAMRAPSPPRRGEGETLELLDPASLPDRAMFPNRPMVAGTGFLVGLGCAALFGVWQFFFKKPLPAVAAR
jgi:hypothetical protein